jgi:type I restriction enzyme S subunit
MSDVDFWGRLLDGVDVEWKPLGDVGTFIRGKRFVKTDLRSEGVPCIHYGEMYTHFGISARKAKSFLDAELASRLRYANCGDVVIVAAGETVEDIGNGTAWLGDDDVVIHDACFAYRSNLNPAYISYFLRTKNFKEQIKKHVSSGKISSINSSGLSKAVIPIPCPDNPKKSLEIQAEIVRILDAMTELTTELNNELTVRKKQYKHYRDQLLSFEDGELEWKTLDEISQKISSGGTPSTSVSEYYDGDIPWLRTQEVDFREIWDTEIKITEAGVKNSSAKWIPANCVIVAMYGATVGKIGINKIPMTTNQACANINLDETVANYRFVFHFLTSQYEYIKSLGAGSQTNINAQIVKNLQVPIPFAKNPNKSLDEQARIVAILDKFDALTNSLTEGLPREIELRQKQYEYYRDLLLSFPKPQEVVV